MTIPVVVMLACFAWLSLDRDSELRRLALSVVLLLALLTILTMLSVSVK